MTLPQTQEIQLGDCPNPTAFPQPQVWKRASSTETPNAFVILIPDSDRQSSKYIQINAGTVVNETGTGGRLCK